jgi:hypothetical protein
MKRQPHNKVYTNIGCRYTEHRTNFSLNVEGSKLQVADRLVEVDLCVCLCLSLILRPMLGRPVCLGIKYTPVAYDQIFITVRHLRVC